MDYQNTITPATNMDLVLFITCILLAGWTLYNYVKTVSLLELRKDARKYAADAREQMNKINATIVEMVDSGNVIQKQYLKLSALNIHYDEIAAQNKYLNQLAPTSTGKEALLKVASEEDTVLHLTIVSSGASIALDNNVTLVYKKLEDRIDFYDRNHWCVISANRVDHPDVFVWLNPYLNVE